MKPLSLRIKKILVATGGSEESQAAVKYAVALSQALRSRLHAVCVVEVGKKIPLMGDFHPKYLEELRAMAEEVMKDVDRSAKGMKVEKEILEGETPAEEIVRYAKEIGADLIVMGTKGKMGIDHYLIGSNAEKVIRNAPCPVTVVRAKYI